ncbi:hypothetical protein ACIGCZ_29180 [Streptomyces nigra]|uniref:hypothetical protein n=1 Tax=Streptomyces nigra TaxID=1827580 RepID=UPI0037D7FB18
MKRRHEDEEPAEQIEEPEEEEDDEPSRAAKAAVIVILAVILWRVVAALPELAYVIVGILGTLGWQQLQARRAARTEANEAKEEAATPDVGEALRRLIGDGNGVLLTRLQRDLKLPNTKAVKALLEDAGIEWKAGVRTPHGNGPGVHKTAIPPALSPAEHSHGDGCCCRSGANANANGGGGEGAGEGIRVEHIGHSGQILRGTPTQRSEAQAIFDRFMAEAFPDTPSKAPDD